MLVLSRNTDEKIIVSHPNGDVILKLTVVRVVGDKVRLGFEAPPTISVDREETFQKIQRAKVLEDEKRRQIIEKYSGPS